MDDMNSLAEATARAGAAAKDPVTALRLAAATFRAYEEHHQRKLEAARDAAKGWESARTQVIAQPAFDELQRKVVRNRDMAEMCEAAAAACTLRITSNAIDESLASLAETVAELETCAQAGLGQFDRLKADNAALRKENADLRARMRLTQDDLK